MTHTLSQREADAARLIGLLAGRVATMEPWSHADWESIAALAQRHEVAPLLYARLKEHGVNPPPVVATELRRIYLASAHRNLRLFHEVDTILHALQAAAIPVVPVKGASLLEGLYGNIALRIMGDADLWVQRTQVDAAVCVLQSLGYEPRAGERWPQAHKDAFGSEIQMCKAGTPIVELHWHIFPGAWIRRTTCIDQQAIWQRAVPSPGEAAFGAGQLSPEDAIIHLCVNLAVNNQMSVTAVRCLLDLDLARQKWSLDWPTVVQRARAWRVSCATWLVLQTLADLFGDPQQALPLLALAPSVGRQLVLRWFVSSTRVAGGLNLSGGPKRFLYLLALVDRPVDALLLLWRSLFPDHFWLRTRYGLQDAPRWRVWLQQLWHPLRIAIVREKWP